MQYKRLRARAFTLIEVIMVTSLVAIVAGLQAANYSNSRKTTRDARRKTDVHTYVAALNSYRLTHSSFYVESPKSQCSVPDVTSPTTETQNPVMPGSTCIPTGAAGRSYGKMNLHSPSDSSLVSVTNANGVGLSYATTSIASALRQGGYLTSEATDPSNSDTTKWQNPDYILVRGCSDGRENISSGGSLFSVWTVLESSPSTADTANTQQYIGSNKTAPTAAYHFDFGVSSDSADKDSLLVNGQDGAFVYAVGNSGVKTAMTNSELKCALANPLTEKAG